MRSFVKIKSSRNVETNLSFADVGISWLNRDFLTGSVCLLTLNAKIKYSQKFPNLQYIEWSITGLDKQIFYFRRTIVNNL